MSRLRPTAPLIVIISAAAMVAAWSAAAVVMSSRGFDITDEGFYILSYRDWDTNLRTFSGSQYLYGPVFDLLGQSVPGLRLFRLGSVVASHAVFAWALVTWLRLQPIGVNLSKSWLWAAALAIVASGGVVYGWLPLSPGYNDVSLLGGLVLMACVLRVGRGCQVDGRIPALPFAAMGPLMVATLLAKSVAGLPLVLFILGVALTVCLRAKARSCLVAVVSLVASLAVTLAGVNFLVMPFSRMLPPIRTVNALVAAETNSPLLLIDMYVRGLLTLLASALAVLVVPSVLALLAVMFLRVGRRRSGLALLAMAPPAGLILLWPRRGGLPPAGADFVLDYAGALTAMALLGLTVLAVDFIVLWRNPAVSRARMGRGTTVVVAAMAMLPAVQSLGTGNPLYVMAVNQIACWVALMVVAAFRFRDRATFLLPLLSGTLVMITVAGCTGISGLLIHPYRADPYREATTVVGGEGVLAGIRVSPERARDFDRLLEVVGPASGGARVVMAFDEMPGLVLLLNARTPGEAWYSATDRARTAAGIRSSCSMLQEPGSGPPVALFNRRPADSDRAALRDCGIVLTADPTTVRVVGQPEVLVFPTVRP